MLQFTDLFKKPLAEIAQIAIDKAIEQGEPGYAGSTCVYYAKWPNGIERRCAMGHFFDDEEHAQRANVCGSISSILRTYAQHNDMLMPSTVRASFLNAVQSAHDQAALAAAKDEGDFLTLFKDMSAPLIPFARLLDKESESARAVVLDGYLTSSSDTLHAIHLFMQHADA